MTIIPEERKNRGEPREERRKDWDARNGARPFRNGIKKIKKLRC